MPDVYVDREIGKGPYPITVTPVLTPTSSTPVGTVIANLSGFPVDYIPAVDADDKRFAIGGNAATGWTVVTAQNLNSDPLSIRIRGRGLRPTLLSFNGSSTVTPVINVLRGVTTANNVVESFVVGGAATADQAHEYRERIVVGATGIKAGTLRAVLGAFQTNQATPGSGAGNVEKVASGYDWIGHIEYNGVAYPAPSQTSVASDASNLLSAPMPHPNIPAGVTTAFYVQRKVFAVGAIPLMTVNQAATPAITGNASFRGATTAVTHVGTAGAFTPSVDGWGTSLQNTNWGALVGEPLDKTKPTFISCGESIEYGLSDTYGDGFNGAGGYIRQALAKGSGTKYGSISIACGAESVQIYNQSNTRRKAYYQYGDVMILQRWGNAYGEGFSERDTWDALGQIVIDARAAGVKKFVVVAPFPKNRTTAYKTWKENVSALSTEMMSKYGIDYYFDINGITLAADGFSWASGYTDTTTDGGTHPLPAAVAILGANLRTAMNNAGITVA